MRPYVGFMLLALGVSQLAPRHAAAREAACKSMGDASGGWTWCENKLTRLSPRERSQRLAEKPVGQWWYDRVERAALSPAPLPFPSPPPVLPSAFSWHNLNGKDWMSGVRDQGSCGSCFVFATLAAVEGNYKRLLNDSYLDIDTSEQQVISCVVSGNCSSGGIQDLVADYLTGDGVADEACDPYQAITGVCANKCSNWQQRRSFINDYSISLWPPWSRTTLKQYVQTYGPLAVSMHVQDDFYGYKSGVYTHKTGGASGWHVVALVGWDDTKNAWIIKNSWDTDWGIGGYGYLSYNEDYHGSSCSVFDGYDATCLGIHAVYTLVSQANTPGAPCIDNHNLTITVQSGQQSTQSVWVKNCGAQYSISLGVSDPHSYAWLHPSFSSSYLSVGSQTKLQVRADATHLATGYYSTDLKVTGGAGTNSIHVLVHVVAVPLDMSVLPDMAEPLDMMEPLDMTPSPDDMSTVVDMAVSDLAVRQDAAVTVRDANANADGGQGQSQGCSCRTGGTSNAASGLLVALALLIVRLKRRRQTG